ncbi:uncharacterized protein EV420DRAFT_1565686 [Desarmillaria tabescens]|uniref:Uncharacterized protein n=1 Tax=Armillaria tabescens TaxID=1929756 RepID=A0AA39JX52_ARMTA|nr:uncharacterized protein EV420DRAFT_1565686 [Desarmillaria tabescens]KAK0449064.1 hypothetical protein EV420DRAFT_1565686 [Desarmillaria tabescens]
MFGCLALNVVAFGLLLACTHHPITLLFFSATAAFLISDEAKSCGSSVYGGRVIIPKERKAERPLALCVICKDLLEK